MSTPVNPGLTPASLDAEFLTQILGWMVAVDSFICKSQPASAELGKRYADRLSAGIRKMEAAPPPPVLTTGEARELRPPIVDGNGDRVHVLKCHRRPFAAVRDLSKGFEYRLFDRDYRVGDVLHLDEFNEETGFATGEWEERRVTYMISEGFGIPPGYCIMGITPKAPPESPKGRATGAHWNFCVRTVDASQPCNCLPPYAAEIMDPPEALPPESETAKPTDCPDCDCSPCACLIDREEPGEFAGAKPVSRDTVPDDAPPWPIDREDYHDALRYLIPDLTDRNAAIDRIMATPLPGTTEADDTRSQILGICWSAQIVSDPGKLAQGYLQIAKLLEPTPRKEAGE